MADIKVGLKQISNPTPAGLNRWVRVITVVGAFFIGWMETNNLIPANVQGTISSIVGGVIGLVNVLAPLWGVQVGESVPSEDVTAVETKP